MIAVSAQISLYPLGQDDLAPAIEDLLAVLSAYGLSFEVGSMSTVVWGDDVTLFAALQSAYARDVERGAAVMAVTISKACPLPAAPKEDVSG